MQEFSKKSRSQLKKTGARRVTGSRSQTEDTQSTGVTAQNAVAMAVWRQNLCASALQVDKLQNKLRPHFKTEKDFQSSKQVPV
jgi:hypothetical protein